VLARGTVFTLLLWEWDMRPFLLLLVLLLSRFPVLFSRQAVRGGYGGYPQKYICVFLW
jgi:hypothetical protein